MVDVSIFFSSSRILDKFRHDDTEDVKMRVGSVVGRRDASDDSFAVADEAVTTESRSSYKVSTCLKAECRLNGISTYPDAECQAP